MITREMILAAIEAGDYDNYGLRYDHNEYNIGDVCENSHEWFQDAWNLENYEELTEDEIDALYNEEIGCYDAGELNGTSAIKVTKNNIDEAIEIMKRYDFGGRNLILIAGDYAEEGNDRGEIVIENATVIAK